MIIPKIEFEHPAIVRVFDHQPEKYPTIKLKLAHSQKCLALCIKNRYVMSIELWEETVAALKNAEFAERVHFTGQ